MQKVYIVPHTHWDREWTFSEQTGNVLLNRYIYEMMDEIEKDNGYKSILDGQASLIDDFISWAPKEKERLINLLKRNQVSLGPWYSQPDVFSSLGETTIRNIEIGKRTIENMGIAPMNTAYMPDTFGFNQNLPQIFLKNGLKNFVHWRGLDNEQIKNGNIYKWKGVDGSEIDSLNYKYGYHCSVNGFPYNNLTNENFNEKINNFNKEIEKNVEKIRQNQQEKVFVIPLGWDQVPVNRNMANFIKKAEKQQSKFKYVIVNNFSSYFKYHKKTNKQVITGDLKMAVTGRVHRTIASNRYDIKRMFRKCEISLYYKLEPLEIMYKKLDNKYEFKEFKLNRIIKPLLKLQAHDSLGGCNTDQTNRDIIAKLKQIYRRIKSQIDLITYNISQFKSFKNSANAITIINQLPSKRDVYKKMKIYSNKKQVNVCKNNIYINTINYEKIGFDSEIYELEVMILAKQMKPFESRSLSIDGLKTIENKSFKKSNIGEWKETLKIENFPPFSFSLEESEGDNYDFSPKNKLIISQRYRIIQKIQLKNVTFEKYDAEIKCGDITQRIIIELTIKDEDVDLHFKFKNNKLSSHRLQLNFPIKDKVYKTQHLAYSEFVNRDNTKDWKLNQKEFPVINDYNDGLIHIPHRNLSILTKGNNEFSVKDDNLSIVMFRTHGLVSNNGMKWRPGRSSGLPYKEKSVDSQLNKEISCIFRISKQKNYKFALNNWNFEPIIHYKNNVHLSGHVHNKFVINDIENPGKLVANNSFEEIAYKALISKMSLSKKGFELRIANISREKIRMKLDENIDFESNKYKEIEMEF